MMNSNAKNINKDIINKDIAQNNSSKKTKSASIRPIFKKDGIANQSNYRPISLLSIFSKIYGRFILENLAVRIHVFRVFFSLPTFSSTIHVLIMLVLSSQWTFLKSLSAIIPYNLLFVKLHAYGFSNGFSF